MKRSVEYLLRQAETLTREFADEMSRTRKMSSLNTYARPRMELIKTLLQDAEVLENTQETSPTL